MTFAAIFAILSKFGSVIASGATAAWPFIKKNWKNILLVVFLVWVVICTMSHCRGGRKDLSSGTDTISVKVDTVWQYPDTAAIFALHGFDTLPKYVRELENRKRFRPSPPAFPPLADNGDSIAHLLSYGGLLKDALLECDSLYGDAIAVRSYSDTLRNDSIEVSLAFNISGNLLGEPKINYRYLSPYPVITNTVTVKETVGPFRGVYLEGGAGPIMTWGNDLYAITGSVGAGYFDKKGWSYGLRGSFNQNGYAVEVAFRRSFSVGK